MKYLTIQQVLAIHDLAVKKYGGSHGIRDMGLVDSAVARPKSTFGGADLYPGIFEKAGALLQSLLKNHPFVDGNKRTALTSAAIFLKMNVYYLENAHKQEVEFALKVDNEHLEVEQIASWLKKHSKKRK